MSPRSRPRAGSSARSATARIAFARPSATCEPTSTNMRDPPVRQELIDRVRQEIESGRLTPTQYYQQLLRLIYRLLFLMVAEERKLIAVPDAT